MAQLHPAHALACWLLVVISMQAMSGGVLALGLAATFLLGGGIRTRWGRLVRRARWLLVSLVAILAWGVAGEPVLADGGAWIPTFEGLAEGGVQLARLLLVLAAVAALMETMPIERLIAGCRSLSRPFRHLGLDVDRGVVRLALVLHYAERMPAGGWRGLIEPAPVAEAPLSVSIALPSARLRDWLALALVTAASALLVAA